MKKVFFVALTTITLTVMSCSKEARLNRKLDGKWESIEADGATIPDSSKIFLTFSKEKKGKGTVLIGDGTLGINGTYELIDDEKIIMAYSFWGFSETDTSDIVDYSRKELKLKQDGETITYKKVD